MNSVKATFGSCNYNNYKVAPNIKLFYQLIYFSASFGVNSTKVKCDKKDDKQKLSVDSYMFVGWLA